MRLRRGLVGLRLLRPVLHACVIFVLFYVVADLRTVTDLIPFVQLRIPTMSLYENMLFAGVSVVIFLGIGLAHGIYELFHPLHAYYKKFLSARGLWMIAMSFVAYMGFGFVFVFGISRFVIVVVAFATLLLLTIIDMVMNLIHSSLERQDPYRMLLLSSDGATSKEVIRALMSYPMYQVTKKPLSSAPVDLAKYDVLMISGSAEKRLLQGLVDRAKIQGLAVYHIGESMFLDDLISQPERIGPLIALAYQASALSGRWRVVKRLIDICFSFCLLVLLSPLLVVIACVIMLDTRGPILYKQQRVGKNKASFQFIKFRTMYTHLSVGEAYGGKHARKMKQELIDSDSNMRKGVLSKIQDDPRVTPVGKRLRKTSLDELPALWSVLIGTMSLVGPRPHEPFEVDQYDAWQERLFSIKPGITGYAQIFGRHTISFDEEARLDLYYMQHRSLFLDLYVLVSTARVLFSGK